jgi:hypothetical protein
MPTTLPPDADVPVAVPHFEDRLLERLQQQRRSGTWARPAWHRWRRPGSRIAVAAAVAAVVVAGAAVTRGTGSDGPDIDTAATAPDDDLPPQIRSILTALDATIDGGSIAHITSDGGTNEAWVDLGSGVERIIAPARTGGRTMDWGRSHPPAMDPAATDVPVDRRVVDHCLHQYADTTGPDLRFADTITPLRDALAGGQYRVSGPAVVEGRELLRLDPVIETPAATGDPERDAAERAAEEAARKVVYIDPATQLPVRIEVGPTNGSTIEYLPRSPENLTLLVPPVPAGYTQVDEIAQDDVRTAGCAG